jgi:hypothetical protein
MSPQIQTDGVGMYNGNQLPYSQQDQTGWATLQQKFPGTFGISRVSDNSRDLSILRGTRHTPALLNGKQYPEQISSAIFGRDLVSDALLRTESFRRSGISPENPIPHGLNGGLGLQSPHCLKPTASVFVPSYELPQVSCLRVGLDCPRARQPRVMPSQHLPVIETTQRIREEQIWNLSIPSSPSPSSWSQKLVSQKTPANRLGPAHSIRPMDSHSEQHQFNNMYEPCSILKDNARRHVAPPIYQTPPILAPSTQINRVVAQANSPPAYRQHIHPVSDPVSKFVQRHGVFPPQFSPSASNPRPPPNTPFSPSLAPNPIRFSSTSSPPSPASPTPRTRTVLRQKRTSVSFTRLIQRRLSAIHEESSSSSKENSDVKIQPTAATAILPTLSTPSSSFASPNRSNVIQCQKAIPYTPPLPIDPSPSVVPSPKIVTVNVRLPPRTPRTINGDEETVIRLSNVKHGSIQLDQKAKVQEEAKNGPIQSLEVANSKEMNLQSLDVDGLEKAKLSSSKRKRVRKPKRTPTSRFSTE